MIHLCDVASSLDVVHAWHIQLKSRSCTSFIVDVVPETFTPSRTTFSFYSATHFKLKQQSKTNHERQPQRKPWWIYGGANDPHVLKAQEDVAKLFDAPEIDEAAIQAIMERLRVAIERHDLVMKMKARGGSSTRTDHH